MYYCFCKIRLFEKEEDHSLAFLMIEKKKRKGDDHDL